MFHVKGAHLAVQRVGRGLLRKFGMTPARYDLMNALGVRGMKQNDLWRRLGVVRSVVCELVRALRILGWVKRVRAADGRTWLVQRTRRGTEIFERAAADCVDNGAATELMDAGLTQNHVESDSLKARVEFIFACDAIETTFRVFPWFRGPDLYGWHPEDYWTWLTDPAEPTGTEMIPWVTDVADQMSVISVVNT